MAEADLTVSRANPLAGLSLPHRVGALAVTDPGPAARFVLRGDATAFAHPLPTTPMRALTDRTRTALWLGPDEWLLIAPDADRLTLVQSFSALAAGNAAVDVSQRNAALILDGPAVGDVLNAGCPLDFDLAVFPVGMCTRTVFGKAEVVLWRETANRFRLEAGRSFMPYIAALLSEAVRDAVA
jgi:sarcosine oxidase, subunit gamma